MYKTMREVFEEFDGEWIFMIDCEMTDKGKVIGGNVVANNKDRDVLYEEISKYDKEKNNFYVRYVGRLPEGVHVII